MITIGKTIQCLNKFPLSIGSWNSNCVIALSPHRSPNGRLDSYIISDNSSTALLNHNTGLVALPNTYVSMRAIIGISSESNITRIGMETDAAGGIATARINLNDGSIDELQQESYVVKAKTTDIGSYVIVDIQGDFSGIGATTVTIKCYPAIAVVDSVNDVLAIGSCNLYGAAMAAGDYLAGIPMVGSVGVESDLVDLAIDPSNIKETHKAISSNMYTTSARRFYYHYGSHKTIEIAANRVTFEEATKLQTWWTDNDTVTYINQLTQESYICKVANKSLLFPTLSEGGDDFKNGKIVLEVLQ